MQLPIRCLPGTEIVALIVEITMVATTAELDV